MSAGWGPGKSRQRSALASGVLASALLLSAAQAQVDRNWLDRALTQASDLSAPWDVLGRAAPEGDKNLEQPWPQAIGQPVSESGPLMKAPAENREGTTPLSVALVDALPYPWAEESRIQVRSELGDPWPLEPKAHVGAPKDQGLDAHADPLLSAEVFESGKEAESPSPVPSAPRSPWFAPTAELVDPWSDG